MKTMFFGMVMMVSIGAKTQDSTLKQDAASGPLCFNGMVETYYSYDFNKPSDNNRPWFLFSHNRHNEFTVNLAYIKASYLGESIRANLALASGTYMNANYAPEPGVLKNIFEANVGTRIAKTKNIWIDAGIFPSHIGFETAISPSCLVLTRSIIADNSPYYESGVKLTYTSGNAKWLLSAMALNGWQRIHRVAGNSLMSWGTQVTFTPSTHASFNYSTFLGTDEPDSARQWRFFHNLYGNFFLTNKVELILGFDLGLEQEKKGSTHYDTWYGTAGILHYRFATSWAAAIRGEYYSDGKGVIIRTGTPNGFKTAGFSINLDKHVNAHFLWRTEFRAFRSRDAVFAKDGEAKKNNTAITSSFALTF
ncbi:MAG: porin [Flavisolibacter sp.]